MEVKPMKDVLLKSLQQIGEKTHKYELSTLSNKISGLESDIQNYRLKVLFVGGFSAGKSALINTLIGNELLEEGQRPETAIAGELVFDTDEYIEAVSDQGNDRFSFSEREKIDKDKYNYLIWHVNCPELKNLGDCTIVDMPGFNSGISDHNKAILRYAEQGSAYVLVIDCEEGTIKQNMTNFIKEIKNYDSNMAIVVSKTDIKLPEDVEKVKKNIEENAQMLFYDDVKIITASKFDADNTRRKLSGLITSFDNDNICYQEFKPEVYDVAMKCISAMEVYKKSVSFNSDQIDEEIKRHEKIGKDLSNQLSKEKSKLDNQFANSVAPNIMADASNALYSHVDTLATAMKAGGNSFSLSVNNILRPVLLTSTKQYVEQSFEKFMADIDVPALDIDQTVENASNAVNNVKKASGKLMEMLKSDNFNKAYKAITTTLSVATSVVAPWLELILIFLPDIIKVISGSSEESQLKNKVNNVIPQIIQKMEPEVDKSLEQMKDDMMSEIEKQFEEKIANEVEMLENVKNEKNAKSAEYERKLAEVDDDIRCIKAIVEAL
jgi:GTP-binding protein EngB required for normal cell division